MARTRKVVGFCLVTSALFASVIVVCALILYGRLLAGPLSLPGVTPYVRSALNNLDPSVTASVDDVVVKLVGPGRLGVRILDVRFKDADDATAARVPEMEVDLALGALVRGIVAPARVRLYGPSATIVRGADGSVRLGLAPRSAAEAAGDPGARPTPEDAASSDFFGQVIAKMIAPVDPLDPLGSLERLLIRDARLDYVNEATGVTWSAPDAEIRFGRSENGIRVVASAAVETGREQVVANLSGSYDRSSKRFSLETNLGDFVPAHLAGNVPGLEFLAGIVVPVSGKVEARIGPGWMFEHASAELVVGEGRFGLAAITDRPIPIDRGYLNASYDGATGNVVLKRVELVGEGNSMTITGTADLDFAPDDGTRLLSAELDLEATEVTLDLPKLFDRPSAIQRIGLEGHWDRATNLLTVARATVDEGPTSISLAGTIRFGDASPEVTLDGTIKDFETDVLPALWPKGFFTHAREWVTERVSKGTLTAGRLAIRAAPGELDADAIPDKALRFDFRVEGASARIVRGLPPLEDIHADMTLHGNSFSLKLDKGVVRQGVVEPVYFLEGGTVEIPNLGERGSPIYIETTAQAKIRDAMKVIDHEPMGFAKKLGLDPDSIGGSGTIAMRFTIPLVKQVLIEEVTFNATAKLTDVALAQVADSFDVTDGRLDLEIDREKLIGTGTVALEGAPVRLDWTETFESEKLGPSKYRIRGRLDGPAAADIGLAREGMMEGPVGLDLTGFGRGFHMSRYSGALDLAETTVTVPLLGYAKAPGEALDVAFDASKRKDGGTDISKLEARGTDASVSGSLVIGPDGSPRTVALRRIQVGEVTDFGLALSSESGNGQVIAITGEALDARPLISRWTDIHEARLASPDTSGSAAPFQVTVDVAEVTLEHGHVLRDVSLDLVHDGKSIRGIVGDANLGAGGKLTVDTSEAGDARRIEIRASPAADLVHGLFGLDQLSGGSLKLVFEPQGGDPIPGKAARQPKGKLTVQDFTLTRAPVLAQLLSIGSLKGLSDTLSGEGIWFRRLEAPFEFKPDGRIHINEAQAAGPALGLTLDGSADLTSLDMNFGGTIVPFYAVNSALGNLPLVGQLLTSREGEGVFGFTYGVSGKPSDLKLFVNPLSGFAPGILRRLFEFGDNIAVEPGKAIGRDAE